MAITNGYATVTEIRDHLGDTGSKLDTDLVERAVNAASRAIDDYCGRRFWQDTAVQTRTYRPRETDIAWVDDISTTTGLVIKSDTSGDYSWAETWDATDYDLEPENADKGGSSYAWWRIAAIDEKRFIVSPHRRTLQVTAKFGWSAVPDQISEACILKATALFRRKDAPFGIAGFGDFGPMRITRRDPDVIELLSNYSRVSVGAV